MSGQYSVHHVAHFERGQGLWHEFDIRRHVTTPMRFGRIPVTDAYQVDQLLIRLDQTFVLDLGEVCVAFPRVSDGDDR